MKISGGSHITFVLLVCLWAFSSHEGKAETEQQRVQHHRQQHWDYFNKLPGPALKPLNVLIISVPMWGHVTPLLAVAEELVLRGHNVTICLGSEGENRASQFEDRVKGSGANLCQFESNASSSFTKIRELELSPFRKLTRMGTAVSYYTYDTLHHLNQSLSGKPSYDIVLGEEFVMTALKCIDSGHHIPSVAIGTTLQMQTQHYPQWAWPSMLLGRASENMSFLQRMASTIDKHITPLIFKYFLVLSSKAGLEKFCPKATLDDLAFSSGISLPHIVPTVVGFDYARTKFPMTENVGPLVSRSPAPLSEEMAEWLARKPTWSVVYVSMGSMATLSKESGRAILEGVMKTNYSLLWSLRKPNQWILEGLEVDPERVLISEWTPQLSVLASPAIHSAILHGGFNGINEALWNGVPVIGLPIHNDQAMIVGRIVHQGLGLELHKDKMTSSAVVEAIATLDAGDQIRNVRRLQKMFQLAGGVRRAADLVEHYKEVGYTHLVPSYLKYRWSWVQYYNADVYALLMVTAGLAIACLVKVCRCCLRVMCRPKQKTE